MVGWLAGWLDPFVSIATKYETVPVYLQSVSFCAVLLCCSNETLYWYVHPQHYVVLRWNPILGCESLPAGI